MNLVAKGLIRPIVDRAFPLEEVEESHRLLQEGKIVGRAVLTI